MAARHLQIFVSSTFADFAAERERIARTLPAALRRRLSGRSIEVSLVDLRWGLTDAQLRESGIVRACLGAVERCSPFFVGLIGDQYGTVPLILPEDCDAYPWLRGLEGKSITELEIIQGVINIQNAGAIFIDRASERPDPRIEHLRSLIDSSGAPVLRGVADVDVMLAFIEEHLAKLIADDVPVMDDPLSVLTELHAGGFFGRDDLVSKLCRLLDGVDPVVWVSGASGAGKSALLTRAIAQTRRFKQQRLAAATFQDEVDLALFRESLAATWRALNMGKRNAQGELDAREFRARLDKSAIAAAADNAVVNLVWDNAPSRWLTQQASDFLNLPKNVRLIVTSRDPPPLIKGISALQTPMPTVNDIDAFVMGRLSSLGRRFPDGVRRDFLQAQGVRDYHFASIALDELVFASSHARLAEDVKRLVHVDGPGALIDQVIESLDSHFGERHASEALLTAYYYEEPIADIVLQNLLGLGDLNFASLRVALGGAFAVQRAGLTLQASYRKALAESARIKERPESDARTWLAGRLLELDPPRRIDAMRQCFRSGDAEGLVALFEGVADHGDDNDIICAAPWLRWAKSKGVAVEAAFSRVLQAVGEYGGAGLPRILTLAALCDSVLPGSETTASFHALVGKAGGPGMQSGSAHRLATVALARRDWPQAITHAVDALVAAVRHQQNEVIPGVLSTLAAAVSSAGRPRIAECWLLAALEILGQMDGRDPGLEATLQSNLGQIFKETGRIDEALAAAQRAVDLRRVSGDVERMPRGLLNLGSVQLAAGKPEAAFAAFSEAWDRATELSQPDRGNIAISLLVAQGRLKRKINALFASLERSLRNDAGVRLDDVIELYMVAAEPVCRARRTQSRLAAASNGAGALASGAPSVAPAAGYRRTSAFHQQPPTLVLDRAFPRMARQAHIRPGARAFVVAFRHGRVC
jgi:tetratricopeptide (TPR) repeat protein